MSLNRIQGQRSEYKYIISAQMALAVRDFVGSYLKLDAYGATRPNYSYPVHSLYLDSDDFALHQSTINGDRNRYKLRIRFYEDRPKDPVYFEIKRRRDRVKSKERAAVRREAVDTILAGVLPTDGTLLSQDVRQIRALQNFNTHLNQLQAKPKVHVAYDREAWLSTDNSARVTIDRNVRSCPESSTRFAREMEDPVYVFGDDVVLELKYTARMPNWFGDLVRIFNLRETSAAKYVDGVVLMEEKHRIDPCVFDSADWAIQRARRRGKVRRTTGGFTRFIGEVAK